MGRSPNSQVLPFPTTKQERLDAIKLHKQASRNNKPIPYFVKEDGTTHYVDNKGRGRFAFNDLATKLRNEASRKAAKKSLTPTLSDYTEIFGEEKGPKMYEAEQNRLKKIYRVTPTATHDVDHIASQADGGPHHSRNLRAQNLTRNRSEGQRGLTIQQRRDNLIGSNPKEHIALQGPRMTPKQRQQNLRGQYVGRNQQLKMPTPAPVKPASLPRIQDGITIKSLGKPPKPTPSKPRFRGGRPQFETSGPTNRGTRLSTIMDSLAPRSRMADTGMLDAPPIYLP